MFNEQGIREYLQRRNYINKLGQRLQSKSKQWCGLRFVVECEMEIIRDEFMEYQMGLSSYTTKDIERLLDEATKLEVRSKVLKSLFEECQRISNSIKVNHLRNRSFDFAADRAMGISK